VTAATMKLRDDLVISRQGEADEPIFVVKNPAAERFYRLKEIEYFIAQQFDGTTTPEIVRQRVEEKFGCSLSPENLEQFIARLQQLGLLTSGEAATTPQPTQGRVRGDFLYLRFKLFDPDRLFDRLMPRVRSLFTPQFLVLSGAMVVWAVGVTIVHWVEIMAQFMTLFRFESLLLAWFVVLGVITLHEFAHGLTCKHFGGRVREIGFLLIYFQPAFYCNVSDAWLFPEKSKRLWVTFAGAYFETFLWALATLVWRVTEPGSSLNHFALVVTATSAFKMFFNLNPLIKLDGYYLLSDWLGIPNLRQKAFGYVGSHVKRLWATAAPPPPEASPRERRIYLTYALLAGAYSYWLLGQIALWFGAYMVQRFQGWGFLIFATLLGWIFRMPLKQTMSPLAANLQSLAHKRLPGSKHVKIGIGCAALLAGLFFGHMELKVSGSFVVAPLHNADVRAEVEGIIAEIYVAEGDAVDKGAPIARLSDRDYRAELRKTRADIEARQAQLDLLKAGSRPEEISLARTQVAKAEERVKYARSRLARDKLLFEQRLVSGAELEESQEMLAVRQKELEETNEQLHLLLAGSRPEEIESVAADVRRLRAHSAYLEEEMSLLNVVAPVAGVITTHKLKEKVGENVKKGDLIAEVHELRTIIVEIAVPEKEVADLSVGQKVVIKARAYPHLPFEGKVAAIAPVATKPTEWQPERTVLVTTRLDNAAGLLKPDMTGTAKIYCGSHRVIDLVTRRLARFIRVEFWSWW
jgi:putative peptide zinc metalloprotease protein